MNANIFQRTSKPKVQRFRIKKLKVREYSNTWKIVEMAANSGLICCCVRPFFRHSFVDYFPTGRRMCHSFLLDAALTHIFIKDENANGLLSMYAPKYKRDLSFEVSSITEESDFNFEHYVKCFMNFKREIVFNVECLNNDFIHSTTGKKSKSYRIWYCDEKKALSKEKCNELQSQLRQHLREELKVRIASHDS